MINTRVKCAYPLMLALLPMATITFGHILFTSDKVFIPAIAQPPTGPAQGMNMTGNQTIASPSASNLIPYNNPNLGFSFQFPSDWQKEESLSFISPQGGTDNRSPEVISVLTEVLPSSDYSLNRYTDAAMGQVESFQNFQLLNSSATTLAGLPAHMIVYTFTDESQTPLQNLQAWTVKDGTAYVITYGGIPEEFEDSLPALQAIMDSFRLE